MNTVNYSKKLKLQAYTTLCTLALSWAATIILYWKNVNLDIPALESIKFYFGFVVALLAVAGYVATQPYLKKKYRMLQEKTNLDEKLLGYYAAMQRVEIVMIVVAVLLGLVSVFAGTTGVKNYGILYPLLLLLTYITMYPQPYTLKQRLQLTNDELDIIFGQSWTK